jgi:hypothetical protein
MESLMARKRLTLRDYNSQFTEHWIPGVRKIWEGKHLDGYKAT